MTRTIIRKESYEYQMNEHSQCEIVEYSNVLDYSSHSDPKLSQGKNILLNVNFAICIFSQLRESKHLKGQLDPPVSDGNVFAPKEVSWTLLLDENTTKLYPGLMIQSRPCWPQAGLGLVITKYQAIFMRNCDHFLFHEFSSSLSLCFC